MTSDNGTGGYDRWRSTPLLAVYAILAGLATVTIAVYKLPQIAIVAVPSKWGMVMLFGALFALYGTVLAVREWHRCASGNQKTFWIPVIAALVSSVAVLGSGEGFVRLLAVKTNHGVTVGNVRLSPTWAELVGRNRRLLEQASPSGTWKEPYLVFDRDLGWVVGNDRATTDGLYLSSAEGIRSGERGIRLANRQPRYRVAIVGDSNAFALEVPFEDSWGHRLEELLGGDVQVLNFGVNGYGLDQAVLRYERDARRLSPDLVILAFIQHNLIRSMVVYPFISFPSWEMPFAKPRFVLSKEGLATVNTPLPEPAQWFDGRDLAALPHVDLDHGYRSGIWANSKLDDYSLLARLFKTLVPRYPSLDALRVMEEETVELNAALLRRFYARAVRESEVLLVYVPTRGAGDFDILPRQNRAREVLSRAGLSFFDLTECIRAIAEEDRRVRGGQHYSPVANRAMARCLEDDVRAYLTRP